ncbi:unnamed protein product [Ceutorhynchus assimilis]|uniref:t-SNARE coiled-coil homology domain-containing protein n=1 Tax=Ceutorhynchus assimilis TaxID=467358 RepID=A0A9N9MIJ0_9CUCU|nr:unnamed protein product [Ceutorhynchus assimilis]
MSEDDLFETIDGEIFNMNAIIRRLESFLKFLGTSKDNEGLRANINKNHQDMKGLIAQVTGQLKKLKTDFHTHNKLVQMQIEKIEEIFVAALNKYDKLQQQLVEKQKQFILVRVDQENPTSDDDELDYNAQTLQNITLEHEKILKRQKEMEELQTNIVDIHEIMSELGAMLDEQKEAIDNVEKNIGEADINIEKGAHETEIALMHQASSTKKRLIILLIAVLLIISLSVLLYFKLK